MDRISPFIDDPICNACGRKVGKINRIVVFKSSCDKAKYLHAISFCDRCDIQYRVGSLCVDCDKPMDENGVVQKISSPDRKWVMGWALCGYNCARRFRKIGRDFSITGWCTKCHSYVIDAQENDIQLVEVCYSCKDPYTKVTCPKCKFAKYCSEECRIADWISHEMYCG